MIDVQALNKWYGNTQALHDVSFSITKGEVVGFLGPNGAGKSTTMKILTGYMPPTSGTVRIGKQEVGVEDIAIQKRLGYLPETNPLYPDFTVEESLKYILSIRQIPKEQQRKAIDRVVDITGLSKVFYKPVHTLSKGYRQRVGLAGALIHDPDILILDEPTSGLDPIQIREIRDLINHIGKSHTVLLSTHIMQEVQAMCDRVLVINQGSIVADDTVSNLERMAKGHGKLEVVIAGTPKEVVAKVKQLAGVLQVEEASRHDLARGQHFYAIETDGASDIREALFELCVHEQWKLLESAPKRKSLEDVFVQLTQQS